MKSTKAALAGGIVAMVLATLVMAQDAADAAKMPCREYIALDAAAMMKTTTAFRADPMAGSMLGDASDDEAMMKIMAACDGMPEMTLMDSMHMKM